MIFAVGIQAGHAAERAVPQTSSPLTYRIARPEAEVAWKQSAGSDPTGGAEAASYRLAQLRRVFTTTEAAQVSIRAPKVTSGFAVRSHRCSIAHVGKSARV